VSAPSRNTVLVIDDDPDYREAVRMILESKGVPVIEAADGAAALALLDHEASRVNLVLLDYWMPGMSALACANGIRARLGADADAEIILVTAASDAAARAAELGIKTYLSKPFGFERLERLVASRCSV
jgi:CheY-like chemotaxis protein